MRGCLFKVAFSFSRSRETSTRPNVQRPTREKSNNQLLRRSVMSMLWRSAFSLHPLWHLNAEKIETALQNARGKITQR